VYLHWSGKKYNRATDIYKFDNNGSIYDGSNVNVNIKKSNLLTLSDMIGTSSAAYVSFIYNIVNKLPLNILDDLNPRYNILCSKLPEQEKLLMTGDGGFCNNLGILSLVARNVKKVISFISDENFVYILNNSIKKIDITKENSSFSQLDILSLFGLYEYSETNKDTGVNSNKNARQIFPKNTWDNIKAQLLNTKQKGGPIYARATLPVLQNKQYAVNGGYDVDLCIIVLQSSPIYNSLLPTNISSTFSDVNGKFPNFPNYPLFFTNKPELLSLTKEQINLLACYTEWSITNTELTNVIKDMYSN
jgi:hypothetical protein